MANDGAIGAVIDGTVERAIENIDPKVQREISEVIGALVLKTVRLEGHPLAIELAKQYTRDIVTKAFEELRPVIEERYRKAIAESWEVEVERAAREVLDQAMRDFKRKVLGG